MMKKIRKSLVLMAVAFVAAVCATRAEAGIISATATGGATIQPTPDGTPTGVPGAINYSMTFAGSGPISPGTHFASGFSESITGWFSEKTFTYDALRDSGAFGPDNRLVLNFTNNTGATINGMDFQIRPAFTDGPFIYGGSYSPGNPGTFTFDGSAYIYNHQNGGGFADGYAVHHSIANGASYAVYIPIYSGVSYDPGSFTITQTTIPEPSSLMLLGLGLAGVGLMKRRNAASV